MNERFKKGCIVIHNQPVQLCDDGLYLLKHSSGIDILCRTATSNENTLSEILAFSKHKNLLVPLVIDGEQYKGTSTGRMLAPSEADYLCPGMVIADGIFTRYENNYVLSHSKTFHNDKEVIVEGVVKKPFKYEFIVQERDSVCQHKPHEVLVTSAFKHLTRGGFAQQFKHINTTLFHLYTEPLLWENNMQQLEQACKDEGALWWDQAFNLTAAFTRITPTIPYSTRPSEKIGYI
jgi:hypothetical protein